MNLYEIRDEIENLSMRLVDEETGEIDESVMKQIESLEMEHDEKIENIGILIKTITAEVDSLAKEKNALDKRIKVRMNKIQRLCDYVNNDLKGARFVTSKVEFHSKKSQAVEIEDVEQVPDRYCTFRAERIPINEHTRSLLDSEKLIAEGAKVTRIPSKIDIKKALRGGEKIAGCSLIERLNLQID